MNRLQPELNRLYGLGTEAIADVNGQAGTRAAVLAVVLPAHWNALSTVWRGVQSELALPPPAIAVSGDDAVQLWFSFATPVPTASAGRFLEGLRVRYLSATPTSQVRVFADAAGLPPAPCVEVGPQRWSAFLAPDLASIFAETPWLDVMPGDDGQAALLQALQPISLAAFDAASVTLGAVGAVGAVGDNLPEACAPARPALAPSAEGGGRSLPDPARFLTAVMTDETAPLALRVEAAKALLHFAGRSG